MKTTWAPSEAYILSIPDTLSLSASGYGSTMTVRPENKPSTAASGPEFSVPAIGCVGIKRAWAGWEETASTIRFFVEPTSTTVVFSPVTSSILRTIPADTFTGVATITTSQPSIRSIGTISSIYPAVKACASCCGSASDPCITAAKPDFFSPMASEQPISPRPITPTVFPCVFIWWCCVCKYLVYRVLPSGAIPPPGPHGT